MIIMKYSQENEAKICAYEDIIFKNNIELINSYKNFFSNYRCTIRIVRFWRNSISEEVSNERLPFINGYQGAISCEIIRDGNLVEIKEAEVDLTASWCFSSLRKKHSFPHLRKSFLQVTLCPDISDVKEQMEIFLRYLSG